MSLDAGDQATIIGIGLASLLVVGGGVWKAASFRGDANARWARRVAYATAALDEKTIAELERLRDDVDEVLPERPFDPQQAITDPAPLTKRAERATALHHVRLRMEKSVDRLMIVGRVALASLIVLIVGTIAATLHYAELWGWGALERVALIVLGLGIVLLSGAGIAYIVLEDQLATGEKEAGTAGRAEDSP